MPLEVLLILVVGGIAAIAGVTHLAGLSKARHLTQTDVITEWARHFPDDRIHEATLTLDGQAALVTTDQGRGLIWAMGADTVARHLIDFDLIDHTDGLVVAFNDYTAPRVHLQLSPENRAHWTTLMTPR